MISILSSKLHKKLNSLSFSCRVYMYMLYVTQLSTLHKKVRIVNILNLLCSVDSRVNLNAKGQVLLTPTQF